MRYRTKIFIFDDSKIGTSTDFLKRKNFSRLSYGETINEFGTTLPYQSVVKDPVLEQPLVEGFYFEYQASAEMGNDFSHTIPGLLKGTNPNYSEVLMPNINTRYKIRVSELEHDTHFVDAQDDAALVLSELGFDSTITPSEVPYIYSSYIRFLSEFIQDISSGIRHKHPAYPVNGETFGSYIMHITDSADTLIKEYYVISINAKRSDTDILFKNQGISFANFKTAMQSTHGPDVEKFKYVYGNDMGISHDVTIDEFIINDFSGSEIIFARPPLIKSKSSGTKIIDSLDDVNNRMYIMIPLIDHSANVLIDTKEHFIISYPDFGIISDITSDQFLIDNNDNIIPIVYAFVLAYREGGISFDEKFLSNIPDKFFTNLSEILGVDVTKNDFSVLGYKTDQVLKAMRNVNIIELDAILESNKAKAIPASPYKRNDFHTLAGILLNQKKE